MTQKEQIQHISGAVIAGLAGTAALGGFMTGQVPIGLGLMGVAALGLNASKFDFQQKTDPRFDRATTFPKGVKRRKIEIKDTVNFDERFFGDHGLGFESRLKRKSTGSKPDRKRSKLGLHSDWTDALAEEGFIDNLDEGPPPTKRAKLNELHELSQLFLLQHKINPFFGEGIMASSRAKTGIPLTRKVTHRVSTNEGVINISTNDDTVGLTVQANALENPFSSAGHTGNAMLFDQMAVIYDKYVVTNSSIRVDFFNDSAVMGVICGLSLKDDVTIIADTGHYSELGGTVYKTLTPKEHSTLTMTMAPHKWFGSRSPTSDSRLVVAAGANSLAGDGADARPTDTLVWHFWAASIDGANTTASAVHCNVTVSYEVQWSEPRALDRSTAT